MLAEPGIRLLTVTGPAGVGKTRFAQELGRRLAADYTGGAYFVALGALADPGRVLLEIAQSLETPEASRSSRRSRAANCCS